MPSMWAPVGRAALRAQQQAQQAQPNQQQQAVATAGVWPTTGKDRVSIRGITSVQVLYY